MYDIKLLEEKWEKYNRKKRKPFYKWVLILSLIILLVGAAFFKKDFLQEFIVSNFSFGENSAKSKKIEPVLLDGPIDTLSIKKSASSEMMTISETKPYVKVAPKVNNNPMDPSDVFMDESTSTKPYVSEKKKVKNMLNIQLTEMSGSSIYQDIEDRFQDDPQADDALFLAREYYSKTKYNKAAYWALQTNKLDGDIEESWLIFAKAKAKLGKKNEAIRVLSAYANKSHSKAAQTLLRKLKN